MMDLFSGNRQPELVRVGSQFILVDPRATENSQRCPKQFESQVYASSLPFILLRLK